MYIAVSLLTVGNHKSGGKQYGNKIYPCSLIILYYLITLLLYWPKRNTTKKIFQKTEKNYAVIHREVYIN